jgi:hypothetical protein
LESSENRDCPEFVSIRRKVQKGEKTTGGKEEKHGWGKYNPVREKG